MKRVIIVDGYSAGKGIAKQFNEHGEYHLIHIQSMENPPAVFGTHDAHDYRASFVYENNPTKLLIEIAKHLKLIDDTRSSEYFVNKKDMEKLRQRLASNIDAIFNGSEIGIELTAELCTQLNCPSPVDPKRPEACRNKGRMRQELEKHNEPVPNFNISKTIDDAIKWMKNKNIKYPVMIKPSESGGTDGVCKCRNQQELKTAFSQLINKENLLGRINKELVVEEFLEGTEYVVNLMMSDSKPIVMDVTRYTKRPIANGKMIIYSFEELVGPDDKNFNEVCQCAINATKALGIWHGPVHAEVMQTKEKAILVEAGARYGGATDRDISIACTGQDPYQLLVVSQFDKKTFEEKRQNNYRILKNLLIVDLVSKKAGVKVTQDFYKICKEHISCIRKMKHYVKPGQVTEVTNNSENVLAMVHLVADTQEELKFALARMTEIAKAVYRDALVEPKYNFEANNTIFGKTATNGKEGKGKANDHQLNGPAHVASLQ